MIVVLFWLGQTKRSVAGARCTFTFHCHQKRNPFAPGCCQNNEIQRRNSFRGVFDRTRRRRWRKSHQVWFVLILTSRHRHRDPWRNREICVFVNVRVIVYIFAFIMIGWQGARASVAAEVIFLWRFQRRCIQIPPVEVESISSVDHDSTT